MSCCCTNILRLCGVDVCDGEIDFGIQAQANGTHRMELEFLGAILIHEKAFTIGEDVKFPATGLNEQFEYLVRLYQPDGGQISVLKDAVTYDCFSVKTYTKTDVTPVIVV